MGQRGPLAFVPAIALAGISGSHMKVFRAGAALGVGLTRRGTSHGSRPINQSG